MSQQEQRRNPDRGTNNPYRTPGPQQGQTRANSTGHSGRRGQGRGGRGRGGRGRGRPNNNSRSQSNQSAPSSLQQRTHQNPSSQSGIMNQRSSQGGNSQPPSLARSPSGQQRNPPSVVQHQQGNTPASSLSQTNVQDQSAQSGQGNLIPQQGSQQSFVQPPPLQNVIPPPPLQNQQQVFPPMHKLQHHNSNNLLRPPPRLQPQNNHGLPPSVSNTSRTIQHQNQPTRVSDQGIYGNPVTGMYQPQPVIQQGHNTPASSLNFGMPLGLNPGPTQQINTPFQGDPAAGQAQNNGIQGGIQSHFSQALIIGTMSAQSTGCNLMSTSNSTA